MRRAKVLRFLLLCLLAGSVIGLISGLAVGSRGSGGASVGVFGDAATPTTGRVNTDPYAGQPMTPLRAELIGSNEMGLIPVIVYNNISPQAKDASVRTPNQFRDDLALLEAEGFYPINVNDLVAGDIDIPAGKSPVVITFDRSYPGHYRILDDGTLDPDSAVGIMQTFARAGYWRSKATFFCLLDVVPNDNEVFGQAESKMEKVRNLVDWGYEIGSNTMTNLDLSKASPRDVQRELAQSQSSLNSLIGDKSQVTSLALPYGGLPESVNLLATGKYEDTVYEYTAVVVLEDEGRLSPSPFSSTFDPMRIPRILSVGDSLAVVIGQLKRQRGLMYISDGDPTAVSAPYELDRSLGEPRGDLGRPVIRY